MRWLEQMLEAVVVEAGMEVEVVYMSVPVAVDPDILTIQRYQMAL